MKRSQQFDLGRDKTRIKDPRDAQRQAATVDALLERLFHPDADRRWELQVLADEVGMGKTFVGLGVAYSVLEAMRNRDADDDLRGCYQKVLIVTPGNSALFGKWLREVGEFVSRCVSPDQREKARRWFAAAPVERVDELVHELRKRGVARRVVIASMGIFGRGRLKHYDLKRRHLLGVLFRYWGPRFQIKKRRNLLRGAPASWPADPTELELFTKKELKRLLFTSEELSRAVRRLASRSESVETLLESCRAIAEPYVRHRSELFADIEHQLIQLYRELMECLLGKSLPLVIVDEAHNWKNGPSAGTNGYNGFVRLIGCRTRRALLLTATPFQLRPAEMLELLKVGDHLKSCPTDAESSIRRHRLIKHRESVVRPVLDRSAAHSHRFTRAWSKLPPSTDATLVDSTWNAAPLVESRVKLDDLARLEGVAAADELEQIIEVAISDVDPDIRQLIREGLRLFVYNTDLSHELGAIVIRHRRRTEHRFFRVGAGYQASPGGSGPRPNQHVLHAAPGLDVKGDGELTHYILMRCVSEMKGGRGRSSLGSALTGCYSTLIESAEGRAIKKQLSGTDIGKVYLDLLMGMVDASQDPRHPKVREVVDDVVRNWQAGEKTLLFCFRTNTAKRLHDIIDARIREALQERQERCLGGPASLKVLRSRLTGKDRDLIGLGLDRILWSILWNEELLSETEEAITPNDLELTDQDLHNLASLTAKYDIDLLSDRADRVFLHRATEYVIADRLRRTVHPTGPLKRLLDWIATEEWISRAYGLPAALDVDVDDDSEAETAHFDERGVHSVYSVLVTEPDAATVLQVAHELIERRNRGRQSGRVAVLDTYQRGPNLWLGADPQATWQLRDQEDHLSDALIVREIHEHMSRLLTADGECDWKSRRSAFQAVRRVILRESLLVRLLPTAQERDESGWGELLVEKFYEPLPQQRECTAHKIAVFLEDLIAASGDISEPGSARYALYDATRLRDQQFVALVSGVHGSRDRKTRERVFSGFNTPLLPDVLICTSVGQEGIDLHRHCRHVVHFDLAWNPAVMEQRTGRTDRIGSKTFRERSLASGSSDSFLDIGVPYLAGTYDERMYEELRLRAQTFEVLTGGDLSTDDAEGRDDHAGADGEESDLRFTALPDSMVESMKVHLEVWCDSRSDR